jgi:hypothetical protein
VRPNVASSSSDSIIANAAALSGYRPIREKPSRSGGGNLGIVVCLTQPFVKIHGGSGHSGLVPESPLSEEVEPLIYSLLVIYIGFGGHWIACLFSKRRISPAATLAAYAYWYSFIQTLLPIVASMPNSDAGLSGVMEVMFWSHLLLSGLIGMLLLVSFLFLFKWIADIHRITILKAFAA